MTDAIAVDRLRVAFNGSEVVRGVSLAAVHGEWLGLIGPNGAGKTTLLRAIAGAVPYGGEALVLGDEVQKLDRNDLARRIAFVPQDPVLPAGMKVVDYVLLGRSPYIASLRTESRRDLEIVAGVLGSLDLSEFAGRDISTLSGGELQRAVIARALAQESPILLLDEPTSALDVGRRQEVMELIDRLRLERGLTVVSALHDLTIAGQFTDRLVMMDGGVVVARGSAREVLTPGIIENHYGANVRVVEEEGHRVSVIPTRIGPTGSGVRY